MTESNGVLAAAARRVLRVLQSPQHRFSNHAIRSNAAYRAERFEEACAEYGRAEAALEDSEGELVAARLKASGSTGEQARVRALAVVRGGTWRHVVVHGGPWRSMAVHGGVWRPMAQAGSA